MEKIGYADRSSLFLQEGLIDYSKVKCELEKVNYGLREEVEANTDFIQPIAIATIISEDGEKILCVKKTKKSTDASSPEFGQTLLYVGGHMRCEDSTAKCRNFLDVLRNTLERELYEELGISFALNQKRDPFVIYTPNSNKSGKHLAIGWVIKLNEGSKLRLDSYELVQKKGRSKSGTFIPFQNITDPDISLESWSKTILLNIFEDKLSKSQKALLRSSTSEQISILES